MADLDELPLRTRIFLKAYPWRRVRPTPWHVLEKPLSRARVAVISSAGFSLPGQPRFDRTRRGGDPTFREIPVDTDLGALVESHRSAAFDHGGLREDPNLGLPLDRLRELRAAGVIGELASRHLSFMGSITAPGRLVRETAPEAVGMLVREAVDVALLVPV